MVSGSLQQRTSVWRTTRQNENSGREPAVEMMKMSHHATGISVQQSPASSPLPPDHLLSSGAVTFPGVFDQHGCPLVIFPADDQAKLSEISKAEVVDFVNYFQCLHNKNQGKTSLVSVVADLSHSCVSTTRFIAETLLLLEQHKQTLHSVYIILPRKKDAVKQLLKLLAPSKPCSASFRKIFLKDIPELFNYIDRSQLPVSLGGYFRYRHQSWVAFVKEIDAFAQRFVSVVQRLPACIAALQALARQPHPANISQLQHFCRTNEAKFLQLRGELGLDELLTHCQAVVEKLREPDREQCYQDMAGTPLFTHTAYDTLQSYSRITAAVEKVELLWQQAFSKAHLQLQVFQLRSDALQITNQIEALQEKLQLYDVEISRDPVKAENLASEFEASIHMPAMALVRCSEDVIHTLAEILPMDVQANEGWVLDLQRLKDNLHSDVYFILQTLRTVSNYHHFHAKASCWYNLVLHENFLQELLSGLQRDAQWQRSSIPAWRWRLSAFLKKNPPPDLDELVHLSNLSNAVPDEEIQQTGAQVAHRCITLRKLLLSSVPSSVEQLQQALQWQFELLRGKCSNRCPDNAAADRPSDDAESKLCRREAVPSSLSSFDSGFDGAGSSQLEAGGEGPSARRELELGCVGLSSMASIQVLPKTTADSLDFEIKVKRLAPLPANPWLSLPVEDLENAYTVTITQKRERRLHEDSGGRRSPPDWTASSPGPDLSLAHDVLSSTVHDAEQSVLCSGGMQTLLWDSYDLHEPKPDADDGGDWHAKERESLRAVEQILGRTEEILSEEENVLAQDAALDQLLWSEEVWPLVSREAPDESDESGSSAPPDDVQPELLTKLTDVCLLDEENLHSCRETTVTSTRALVNAEREQAEENGDQSGSVQTVVIETQSLEDLCVSLNRDEAEDGAFDPGGSGHFLPGTEDDLRPHELPDHESDSEFNPGSVCDLNESDDDERRLHAPTPSEDGGTRMSHCDSDHLHGDGQQMSDFKTPIVMDTGSGLMKAGFADEERPSITFPTVIGTPKYEEIMNGDLQRESYIGHDAQHMRGVLALKHPIKNGIIRNWDQMEKIWHHAFLQLSADPEDHPVLLTEAAMNPLENRQRTVELMFERFGVPLTYVAMQAVLALYAAGRTTGVVFDSGDGASHSVPVYGGYCLPHAVRRFPLAGGDVTAHLKKLLQEQGVSMRTSAEEEIVREMKETCCHVALDYEAQLGQPSREAHYSMPDGQVVTLGTERFRAPEILFKPQMIGRDHYGMHETIYKSIMSSDMDLRRCLLENIVLSGGNTLLPGLPERLQAEISGLLQADQALKVQVFSPKDRDFLVWSGGAVLANLPTFSSAWISQEEYEEYGSQIVFRKCF